MDRSYMRKVQKKQIEELLRLFEDAQNQFKKYVEQNRTQSAIELLQECQNSAISLGTAIENIENEGHPTVILLEEYCELLYQCYESLIGNEKVSVNQCIKLINQKLIKISNSVKNDIKIKIEAVFLPYKASMWDSLESIWQAADADPDCDAYVIPIPYFDKRPDGSFGQRYYEANQYPGYVPVVNYEEYDFEIHRPDLVFIHNPYDEGNFITSVHPYFYSDNIKKYTDCLIYVPYFATAGGMSEGQALCLAYINADYIVIQSEKYREYYDPRIPDSKFLAMGSPKFDSIIHKCQSQPNYPKNWIEKVKGKKIYFYNTSIGGMLENTDAFLKKMKYVFDIFKGREDACILWRPHPLMESTFESMREEFYPRYKLLKKEFIENQIGIYDKTPSIEDSIALADVYIGDAATSVTSLFGVVGKPLFILNNYIHSLPEKDDWRGERINMYFDEWGNDRYQVTMNNQLWFSENNDYHYKFYMDLKSGYSGGRYYMRALEIKNKIYVLPYNAQHLLIIKDKIIRKIEFPKFMVQGASFFKSWHNQKYIFLFPYQYPKLIRINIETEEIHYVDGLQSFYVRNVNGRWQSGGIGLYKNEWVFASPEEDQFVFMNIDTFEIKILNSNLHKGVQEVIANEDDLWLIPFKGRSIWCWNPKTGDIREYNDVPVDFCSISWPYGQKCDEHPFGGMVFSNEGEKETIIISPYWGNMFLSLDKETGKMEEWKLPMGNAMRGKNGYFITSNMGGFIVSYPQKKAKIRLWYVPERKLFDLNLDTKEYKEVEIDFDYEDLLQHEPGFMEESEWMQYCLNENAFHSLKDLLDNNIIGSSFDKERQLQAFAKINANTDGTCGKNIYKFVKEKV